MNLKLIHSFFEIKSTANIYIMFKKVINNIYFVL